MRVLVVSAQHRELELGHGRKTESSMDTLQQRFGRLQEIYKRGNQCLIPEFFSANLAVSMKLYGLSLSIVIKRVMISVLYECFWGVFISKISKKLFDRFQWNLVLLDHGPKEELISL